MELSSLRRSMELPGAARNRADVTRTDFSKTLVAGMTTAALFAPIRARAAQSVSVLYAGSLVTVMEHAIVPALAKLGFDVEGEAKGSVALAKLIEGGLRTPDVFISADPKVIDGMMGAANKNLATWYAVFASTRLVIGYAPTSPLAGAFADVVRGQKKLTDVLLMPNLRLGRTDPALDPKGYRSILAAKLLESDGAGAGFARKLLGDDRNPAQVFPEETLLARLETGDLDAAFLYATESTSRHLPAVELPATANLGEFREAAHYATASVTIDGVTRTGGVAAYALTIPSVARNAVGGAGFVAYLFSSAGQALLKASGVTTFSPVVVGDRATVPASVSAAIGR
jgi:molybdate/tungstate transport system substrate-binding protein